MVVIAFTIEGNQRYNWRKNKRSLFVNWTDRAPGAEARSAEVGAQHSQPQAGWSTWTAKPTTSKGRWAARPSWPTLR